QIGHQFVERAINDYTQSAVVWIVRGNEKHRAPKIRIEHVGMSDEQCSGETPRRFAAQITHAKLECSKRVYASFRLRFIPSCRLAASAKNRQLLCELCSASHKSCKILLRRHVSSITSNAVFQECSGGNSRPSRPSGVGGGTFLMTKSE